ncbi:YebG family protein [Halioxenophilus sp. WMMB6]|uniref:YebG family protein n=1 Tax=Halioxenophilus sp. WMMB6 TaxID=3073815 RepID=UPI00295EE9E1|nr:YebG family protein [Halioxenophilus sp. WMMB6]
MAVIAVWKCDRDGAMFENKKDADEHDSMLELAANITQLLEQEIPSLNEEHGETIGLILAQRREVLARACKGKPNLLLEESEAAAQPAASKVDNPTQPDSTAMVENIKAAANS